jgi:protein-L-isoaspartate O-methyltransferase
MLSEPARWLDSVRRVAPGWVGAFEGVPREWFVPDRVWRKNPAGRGWLQLHRALEPEVWAELVARDDFVVTQVDDGRPELAGGIGRAVTSSTSMPTVMAVMLHALDLPTDLDRRNGSGMRVLEIGTGTGWNTALLAHRLGTENVTSIEIDPAVAAHARAALSEHRIPVTVIVGDGEHGHPAGGHRGARYDRVLSTAACHRVPYAWIEQCTPGGVIVTPWQTPYLGSALLRLTVTESTTGGGVRGSGRFIEHASFMPLRGQRVGAWIPDPDTEPDAAESRTALHPYEPVSDYDGCAFAVSLLVPGVEKSIAFPEPRDRRTYEVLLFEETSRSWATITVTPAALHADTYPVRQHGRRRLWDEVEAAHTWWEHHARPTYTDFGLTVEPTGQHAWLGDPSHRLRERNKLASRTGGLAYSTVAS